ncbi:MAG: antibiotic biosynthesis monooxygenase [Deltaproteobacteria bacterium]|jgi:heme-degrading monooxygenase HmoA|nr:antibiotic biosynthesis monooxygenase [Deltaproteobacteria bacterium]MBW2489055.1 antibiotic biosynthesis monooxygenase [Deltaproteobacteria bacterium]MBW2517923.1 antibiotic biosynthesis monooxygenase [Deltaproteobacteria bacterium]
MAVKIFIRRRIPEDRTTDLLPLFRRLRNLATNQSGYISGETLRNLDDTSDYLVISTWQSIDNWREWVVSRDRMEIQNEIDARLTEASVYEIYQYG